ncbi:hypothetical protein BKA62DRAFT_674734 [Auriculariales sp. MPI-PUGE-AT-0066]|nr:hypothetical protein BKA62DRAFT_674734 [Auriculariales sp. MPI-PUGE-AT-0066]
MAKCNFCNKPYKSSQGVTTHLAQDKECKVRLGKWKREMAARLAEEHRRAYDSDSDESQHSNDGFQHLRSPQNDSYFDIPYDPEVSPARPSAPAACTTTTTASIIQPQSTSNYRPPVIANIPTDDEEDYFVKVHPTAAMEARRRQRAAFETDYAGVVTAEQPHGPFPTRADWEMAEWSTLDAHPTELETTTAREFHSYVDKLPNAAEFEHKEILIEGQTIPFDCFYRNALDLVRDLISDPTFDGQLLFRPTHRYTSSAKRSRKYSEWNTGDWAWEVQAKLPRGATTIPIILATDKTELTSFTGKQSCYPVYMTIANIPKHLRRQPSTRAWRLLAYLPTGKLFHQCMTMICQPLFEPAKHGEELVDAQGVVRTCHTILAAYAADYPEQCLVTCVRYGQACPICDTLLPDFDKDEKGEMHDQADTLATIQHARAEGAQDRDETLKAAGLTNVPDPFWKGWTHANVHAAMSSDVLHQLVQGMGKHLVEWLIELTTDEDELDARFQRIPYATGLRHFRDGISALSNVSGTEHKAIYAQLLGCIHGIVPDDAVRAACSLLDFIYVAQYECHSDDSLKGLEDALSNFHMYKSVFSLHNVRKDFNLPKLHACQHYADSIRRFGTVDNYNTECTERLHIDLAKHAYAATNKRDYEHQMCRWLQRREAVLRFRTYLDWKDNKLDRPAKRAPLPSHPIILTKKPHRQRYTVRQIQLDIGQPDFRKALANFLCSWHRTPHWPGYAPVLPPLVSSALERLSYVLLWNHVKFVTPNMETLASQNFKSTAYASPMRKQYDPVLVRLLGEDIAGTGGINDLHVGRLRALFKVPELYADDLFGAQQPSHLALIDLYLPLSRREDDINGMYLVKKPPQPQLVIVEVNSLRRAAHLFPKFGVGKVDRKLTPLTVLDAYNAFYLNNHVDKDAFRSIYWEIGEDDETIE